MAQVVQGRGLAGAQGAAVDGDVALHGLDLHPALPDPHGGHGRAHLGPDAAVPIDLDAVAAHGVLEVHALEQVATLHQGEDPVGQRLGDDGEGAERAEIEVAGEDRALEAGDRRRRERRQGDAGSVVALSHPGQLGGQVARGHEHDLEHHLVAAHVDHLHGLAALGGAGAEHEAVLASGAQAVVQPVLAGDAVHGVDTGVAELGASAVVQRVGADGERELVGPQGADGREATGGVGREHLHEGDGLGVGAQVQVGHQGGGELARLEAQGGAEGRVAVREHPQVEVAAGHGAGPALGLQQAAPAVGELGGGGRLPGAQERSAGAGVILGVQDEQRVGVDGARELVGEASEVGVEAATSRPIGTR